MLHISTRTSEFHRCGCSDMTILSSFVVPQLYVELIMNSYFLFNPCPALLAGLQTTSINPLPPENPSPNYLEPGFQSRSLANNGGVEVLMVHPGRRMSALTPFSHRYPYNKVVKPGIAIDGKAVKVWTSSRSVLVYRPNLATRSRRIVKLGAGTTTAPDYEFTDEQ